MIASLLFRQGVNRAGRKQNSEGKGKKAAHRVRG
jgi:hypothetical protein